MLSYSITKDEFKKIAKLVYDQVGIHLAIHKMNLVKSRLSKRLRYYGFNTFEEYYLYLIHDNSGEELLMLINEITTNVTSFFREPKQWEYLEHEINRIELDSHNYKLRIWSAACSSGQEPYTIAIFLLNTIRNINKWDIKILATDISDEILIKAQKGIYTQEEVNGLPKNMLSLYFEKERIKEKDVNSFQYKIKNKIKDMIIFKKFNLVYDNYSIINKNTFDLVFCRNVMIYFDKETKNKVVTSLVSKIKPSGHLLIGHSESLVSMNDIKIKLSAPSIYKKE